MTEPQLLWEYQIQLRRIAEHRQQGVELSIRREYKQVLQKLQVIIAKYYAAYGNSDDSTMTQGDLRSAGQYKTFLQDVLDNLDGIAEPVDKQIRQTIEDTYTTCYNGMVNAVKQSTDNTQLGSLLSGLSSTTPETVKNIVENPMQKLTLSTVFSRRRNQIVKSTKKTLAVGLASGDSYTRMAQRIADTLNGDYKKAMRIVRTEANRAINRGFQDVTEEASEMLLGSDYVEVKEWCSMEDESVRSTHQHLNGKKIHALDVFESHGAKADCPGSFGIAKEDINCRCFLMYSFMSRDEFIAQGGVIPDSVLQKEKELGLTSVGEHDDIDYMSKFNPTFSDEKVLTTGNLSIRTKTVSNSKFKMFTDIDADRKNKAVRLTEKNLIAVQKSLPENFEMPSIAVVDFNKHKLNTYAIGGYDKNTGIMYINSRYDTKEKVFAYVNQTKGQFANTTEYAPILHELGHKYYEDSIKKLAISENMSYNDVKKKIDRRIFNYIKNMNHENFIRDNLSGYADDGFQHNSYTEIIAESFSVKNTNEIAKEILKLLEGLS